MARFAVNDKVQIKVPENPLYGGRSAIVKEVLRDEPGVYKVELDVGGGFIVGENQIVRLGEYLSPYTEERER